jgi:hypothetical protein
MGTLLPLCTLAISQLAHGQASYSPSLIHEEAVRRGASASLADIQRLNRFRSRITECPTGTTNPHDSEGVVHFGATELQYVVVMTGDETFCMFLTKPEERPLSVAEAIDLQALHVFPPVDEDFR